MLKPGRQVITLTLIFFIVQSDTRGFPLNCLTFANFPAMNSDNRRSRIRGLKKYRATPTVKHTARYALVLYKYSHLTEHRTGDEMKRIREAFLLVKC